jgi:flagellar hook-associated protein 1 FlgK
MSLFGAIQLGGNTLSVMQIGLHVVGNNIANANTPGYVRQEAIFVPAPIQQRGGLILGTGVTVEGIVQKLDRFVLERLVSARGDRSSAELQERVYRDLEVLLNELSADSGLSNALTGFFNALDEVMKDPANLAVRHGAVMKGIALSEDFQNLHNRATNMQQELDRRVHMLAGEINAVSEEIRQLNVQISAAEGGGAVRSDAGSLRVRRQNAIDRLSELVGVQVVEQPSGAVAVSVGGEFLVFEGQRREVVVAASRTRDLSEGVIEFTDTRGRLGTTGGELAGLYVARDQIVKSFLNQLDELAGALSYEFNKLYSQGQGLVGFNRLTSAERVNNVNAPLDAAGLAFEPVSGKFDIIVSSKENPTLTRTHTIFIQLNGLDEDTSLTNLAEQLDSIDGLTARISTAGALELSTTSSEIEFSFAGDTSGVLAALGLNTFFTGSSAATLGVNSELKGIENAAKFAASLGGIGNDADNLKRLVGFLDQPLESAGNVSLSDLYNQLLNNVAQGSAISQSVAEGFRIFEATLEGQSQAVSGVRIDEEAIKMLTLQRIYQASARFIQAIAELLDTLVKL